MTKPARVTQSDMARAVRADSRSKPMKKFPKGGAAKAAKSGFVYVIGDGSDKCKVGFSQTPKSRLANLRNANPGNLQIVVARKVDSPFQVEQVALRILAPFRARGEWFNCAEEYAVAAVDCACGIYRDAETHQMIVDYIQSGGKSQEYERLWMRDASAAENIDPFLAGLMRVKHNSKVKLCPRKP